MEPEDPEVATTLEPYPEGPEKPTVERKKRGNLNKLFLFVVIVAVILGAAVAAAIVFVKQFGNNESDPTAISNNDGGRPPIIPPPAPVKEPTVAPVAATEAPVAVTSVPVPATGVPEIDTTAPTAPSVATNAPVTAPVPVSNSAETLRTTLAPVVLDTAYLESSSTALEWLVAAAEAEGGSVSNLLEDEARLVQRYALLSLDLMSQGSLTGTTTRVENLPRIASGLDECLWVGVTCTNGTVTQIRWSQQSLSGSISENIGLLTNLEHVDLGENELQGPLPQGLYNLANLQYLYLHSNFLTGTISESIANLFNLRNLYLSNNQLTGAFPVGLGSPSSGQGSVRPLRFLTLFNNKMSGTLPAGLNLRNLFYLDIGRNAFSGTIPIDWYEGRDTMNNLRHLYADYNQFSGGLTYNFPTIGGGRIDQVSINDNQLTGDFPGGWDPINALEILHIENNQFSSLSKDFCIMSVFVGGEVTDLRSDCSICPCNDVWCSAPFCT
ncbi:hypothetical protein FisN_13Lh278 [Fistulifera solaris]|uniref:Leucine-rich repeat-containing N-terminal plant-type domain-containing protein n=1 Tax=Fistulifera solaris TaxID=1519565 RepID=A0A1Z5KMB8_FISSO|nr:hypothetical protein FisN_13Lh278 [Fistulifera solaris]|eukprot:GAX27171.1 hypothetical protein FisN_13Lh278 [Fistulifera solaris]